MKIKTNRKTTLLSKTKNIKTMLISAAYFMIQLILIGDFLVKMMKHLCHQQELQEKRVSVSKKSFKMMKKIYITKTNTEFSNLSIKQVSAQTSFMVGQFNLLRRKHILTPQVEQKEKNPLVYKTKKLIIESLQKQLMTKLFQMNHHRFIVFLGKSKCSTNHLLIPWQK